MESQWDVIADAWRRPLIEVCVDGKWCKGEVRARRHDGEKWEAWVVYSTGPAQNYSGTFDFDLIRLDGFGLLESSLAVEADHDGSERREAIDYVKSVGPALRSPESAREQLSGTRTERLEHGRNR